MYNTHLILGQRVTEQNMKLCIHNCKINSALCVGTLYATCYIQDFQTIFHYNPTIRGYNFVSCNL